MSAAYETQVRDALATMLRLMEDHAGFERDTDAQSRRLCEQLRVVEQLAETLPEEAPEMLRHFLERRSYSKALDLLLDRMSPAERAAWKPGC